MAAKDVQCVENSCTVCYYITDENIDKLYIRVTPRAEISAY